MRRSRRVEDLSVFGEVGGLSPSESRRFGLAFRSATGASLVVASSMGVCIYLSLSHQTVTRQGLIWGSVRVAAVVCLGIAGAIMQRQGWFEYVRRSGVGLLIRDWPEPQAGEVDPIEFG